MFKLLSIILSFSIFWGCASRGPKDTERAHYHLQIGTAHLQKGNYPAALSELLTAQKLNPRGPVIQNNLGLAYFVRKKYSLAQEHILKALKLDPTYTEARNNLGRLYVDMGLYKKAIHTLKMAQKDLTFSSPEKIHATLGWAYFMDKDFRRARRELSKSLKIRRKSCSTNNLYARTMFELKEFEIAADSFDQTLNICDNKDKAEPMFYSGLSYYKLGQLDKSKARLEEVIANYSEQQYAKKARSILNLIGSN